MSHTKGEWIVSNSGEKVISLEFRIVIASGIQRPADAHLISAASDLLGACELLLTTLLEAGYDPEISRVKEIAVAAIAKAKKEGGKI